MKYLVIMLNFLIAINVFAYTAKDEIGNENNKFNQWLKNEFSQQHEKLIPIVAVADMFVGCNAKRNSDQQAYTVRDAVVNLDKSVLAEKLETCLAGDSVKSDQALNFGLTVCFSEQLDYLDEKEKQAKMVLVEQAVVSLPRAERQKSFTQCVTDQAIRYLQ